MERSTKVDVNKVLRINRKNLILLIVLIWSFLRINDLKEEGGASKGNPPGVGCEKVLENRWNKYSLLLKIKESLTTKRLKRPINVNKWFKWLYKFCQIGGDSDEWSEQRNHERGRLERLELDEEISWPGENLNDSEKVLIIISCAIILNLIIYSLLLSQNVESNPGPPNTFKIVTYNCNGLGDKSKLRRVLNKAEPIIKKGGFVFLQETHLKDTGYLKIVWKYGFVSNCISSNSAGVLTLYNNNYNVLEQHEDGEGRQMVTVVGQEESKYILTNAYFPNDHKASIEFTENLYNKTLESQNAYPEAITIMAGDLNTCLKSNDSLNRLKSQNEKILSENILSNNRVLQLADAYRTTHSEGGFTWNRGKIYSRLDYIFVSEYTVRNIVRADLDWVFDKSDHAAVMISIRTNEEMLCGPGPTKVNTKCLEDPKRAERIGHEIGEMMSQVEEHWNPHQKLEFLKVAIRTAFANETGEKRKVMKNEINETEEEVNGFESLKLKVVNEGGENNERSTKIELIEVAIRDLKTKLEALRRKFNDTRDFVSRAKWFEYGEKPNKFFLNLSKAFQKKKMIASIKNGESAYEGQEQVTAGIKKFYSELYAAKSSQECEDEIDEDFYRNCPKLTSDQRKFMDEELGLEELKSALLSCKDSAPGPDGIPYNIYKRYWEVAGPIILEAWKYSMDQEKLPQSHSESSIVLLPKDGKDCKDIKNWRPITLSNCDAKIITKALARKTAKVLESIIDPNQTAYVPGRSVMDNLRTNLYYKKYCEKHKIPATLISLDAKKAFDSVNHKYIEKTLINYGFGGNFVKTFRTLYKNLTAKILINGFYSEAIKIERGVKQGDALSCAIFIICIDPVLRNINSNKNIKPVMIKNRRTHFKAAAYADDISVICLGTPGSINEVFKEYERLTTKSGLELNADKTEILNLIPEGPVNVSFEYNQERFELTSVSKMKICGIYYCSDLNEEHHLNVSMKIDKLSEKLKRWSSRNLTMEGKVLIVKTFGLSQIIYNMQSYEFKAEDILKIERQIFGFLWATKENSKGIDRIKRSIMKNDYDKGGMKVPDTDCLNRALKMRQYVRAYKSNHTISEIQSILAGNEEHCRCPKQEYHKVTEDEAVSASAQSTINILTDNNRKIYEGLTEEEYECDINLIKEVCSINTRTYLERKNRPFAICMNKAIFNAGILTLGELVREYESENDPKMNKLMKISLSNFPNKLIKIAECFNEGIYEENNLLRHLRLENGMRIQVEAVTAKELQNTLKVFMNKIEKCDFKKRLDVQYFDDENIMRMRQNCRNSKLRNIYFRLTHNDFFTRVRMKKYKMVESNECERCNSEETTKHLLWECVHANNIWSIFNVIMSKIGRNTDSVGNYDNIYDIPASPAIAIVKLKIIQEMVQVVRPKMWNMSKMINLIRELKNIESYNAKINRIVNKLNNKWSIFENILKQ